MQILRGLLKALKNVLSVLGLAAAISRLAAFKTRQRALQHKINKVGNQGDFGDLEFDRVNQTHILVTG